MTKAKGSKRTSVKVKSTTKKLTSMASKTSFEKVIQEADMMPAMQGGWRLADGLKHLASCDDRFIELISTYGIPEAYATDKKSSSVVSQLAVEKGTTDGQYFSLIRIIIYQQLSATSADPILQRFISAFGISCGTELTPEMVKNANFETAIIEGKKKILLNGMVSGLSESKAKYIKDLTDHFLDPNKLQNINLSTISDTELHNKLLAVKGLGQWSVDMFMLFVLQRSNILPIGDLIVRKNIAKFFHLSENYFDQKKNILEACSLCQAWAPYCSLASCYMWKY